ncbi:MAG: hypothetical protein J2P31_13970 [Blastocatellia bacterium]|nr:hypothetical protein [Blastocatellia bacterium]
MKYDKLKKVVVTSALALMFLLGLGIGNSALAQNHRGNDHRDNEKFEREKLDRIRHLDHEGQLRYQNQHGRRIVGYHDRAGHFHRYGWYDKAGRLHIY